MCSGFFSNSCVSCLVKRNEVTNLVIGVRMNGYQKFRSYRDAAEAFHSAAAAGNVRECDAEVHESDSDCSVEI